MSAAFVLRIELGNAAFSEEEAGGPAPEVARLLRDVADRVEDGHIAPFVLVDYNGNQVGLAGFTDS